MASNRPSKSLDDLPVGAYGRLIRSFSRHDYRPVDGQLCTHRLPRPHSARHTLGTKPIYSATTLLLPEQGEETLVSLSFEPNAWTFQEGHAIRLVLTGSDVDNFSLVPGSDVILPRKWRAVTSSAFLSLPVLDQQRG